MKTRTKYAPLMVVAFAAMLFTPCCGVHEGSSADREGQPAVGEVARYLAGMPQTRVNKLSELEKSPAWKNHAAYFDALYATMEKTRIPAIRGFIAKELGDVSGDTEKLLYLFSGPDFFYADLFFPNAKQMVLFGLERVGQVPPMTDLDPARQQAFFDVLRQSLVWMYDWGYFVTTFMGEHFSKVMELRGVVPLVLFFMARAECDVTAVERVTVDQKGNVISAANDPLDVDAPGDLYVSGVRITYKKNGEKETRTLYYWSHDLSDGHLAKTPHFVAYMDSLKFDTAYFKAASYLPYWMNYCRNLVLNKSKYIFQSDSGVPYKYFTGQEWTTRMYGNYMGILGVFPAWAYQTDLAQRYATDKTVKPVPFGICYGFRLHPQGTNLMVAKRSAAR
ncbi:MAG: hypothetical protein EPN93_12345 [Spirochaetes bacterium]|nr:MAG: hypothetical protein EPN93_12345 [Spirochaetota bacterium]